MPSVHRTRLGPVIFPRVGMSGRGHPSRHETSDPRQGWNRACRRRPADSAAYGHLHSRLTRRNPVGSFHCVRMADPGPPRTLRHLWTGSHGASAGGSGFNIKNTAKTAEQVLGGDLPLRGRPDHRAAVLPSHRGPPATCQALRVRVGAVLGIFSVVITLIQGPPATGAVRWASAIWVLGLFLLWGWGIARLYLVAFPAPPGGRRADRRCGPSTSPTSAMPLPSSSVSPEAGAAPVPAKPPMSTTLPPEARTGRAIAGRVEMRAREAPVAEAHVISRRRFLIQMGGLIATIVVVGADVAQVLRAQAASKASAGGQGPYPLPQRNFAGAARARHASGIHRRGRPLPHRHRPHLAGGRPHDLAPRHQRPGRPPSVADARPDQDRLQVRGSVRDPLVHLQRDRRTRSSARPSGPGSPSATSWPRPAPRRRPAMPTCCPKMGSTKR